MKVLLANKFFFYKGGAEVSFFGTARVLRANGHEVVFFSMDHPENRNVSCARSFVSRVDFEDSLTLRNKLSAAGRVLYSFEAKRSIDALLQKEKPDLVHLHNIHHQISPSIFPAIKKHGIPVVMTLHDYKMVCPVYTLTRNGRVCEKCAFGKFHFCFFHRCCKKSLLKSSLNTLEMYFHHKMTNLYGLVDVFISPSRFLLQKTAQMGFTQKVHHLPNFIDCRQFSPSYGEGDGAVAYFGRISREKGLFTLIEAVAGLNVRCMIYGEGPLKADLERMIAKKGMSNVVLAGHFPSTELMAKIREHLLVVLPSEWYENSPLSILEAFALGKPVIGSQIGGISELIQNGRNGLTFESGNRRALRERIDCLANNVPLVSEMGKQGRRFVEQERSPEEYYKGLMKLYRKAKENRSYYGSRRHNNL